MPEGRKLHRDITEAHQGMATSAGGAIGIAGVA